MERRVHEEQIDMRVVPQQASVVTRCQLVELLVTVVDDEKPIESTEYRLNLIRREQNIDVDVISGSWFSVIRQGDRSTKAIWDVVLGQD
jgi:hypothetical protein